MTLNKTTIKQVISLLETDSVNGIINLLAEQGVEITTNQIMTIDQYKGLLNSIIILEAI